MKIAKNLYVAEKQIAGAIRTLIVGAFIASGLASATTCGAQPQQQALQAAAAAKSTMTTKAGPVASIEFEVASIKLSNTASANGFIRMGMRYTDDGFSAENWPLMLLVQAAYGVNKDRLSGAPDWLNSERYDIEAKVDGTAAEDLKKLSPNELKATRQHMLQALLADRFKLTLHRETKELAVYNLVVAKGGPKLEESKPEDLEKDKNKGKTGDSGDAAKTASRSGPLTLAGGGGEGSKTLTIGSGGGNVVFAGRGGTRTMSGRAVTLENLTTTLASAVGRPVFDKTGLAAKYNYRLEYVPEDNRADAESAGPSIFTAVQEQLGLKLESAKGPVEIFVIDHIERASGN